jgi:hypothetical protein
LGCSYIYFIRVDLPEPALPLIQKKVSSFLSHDKNWDGLADELLFVDWWSSIQEQVWSYALSMSSSRLRIVENSKAFSISVNSQEQSNGIKRDYGLTVFSRLAHFIPLQNS